MSSKNFYPYEGNPDSYYFATSFTGPSATSASKYKTLKITYSKNKLSFLWSPIFFAFWGFLVFLVWWRLENILPEPLTIENELNNTNEFIAERAERRLQDLVRIGPRVVGSANNEQAAVRFLLDSIENIRTFASNNQRIEVDRQLASGHYGFRKTVNIYRNIQNVIVKLTSLDTASNSSLLINSHFDSVPGSPGAGDDGTMVAVMLEVLKVLAQSRETLKHPIIFLFNGAEENPLQGSHAFITQHKWATNIKAFINLDSAGNGGREILFQTGPEHPWLLKYYSSSAKHHFATTIGEEMFQKGLVPSDTDFRIFRDYGFIPGLDLAHCQNGYVYHTEHDKINTIPRGTLQHTGDNILALAKAIANSDELENPNDHDTGHTIFYDFLGFFLISYTATEGLIINISISIIAILIIILSFFLMKKNSGLFCRRIFMRFVVIFLIQIASLILAFGLTIGIAFLLDGMDYSMSWYTNCWMVFGLYFCPIIFALSIVPLLYIKLTEENEFFPLNYKIQMFMHSNCLLLVIITLSLSLINIHSSFLFMISVFFYTIALILNMITTLQGKSLSWIIFPIISQIVPILFYTYNVWIILMIFIPMTGRSSPASNPEILISLISFVFAFLITGFLIPLLFVFRKSEILVTLFGVIGVIFIIFTVTPIGFPYKDGTSFQRFSVYHSTRIFRDRNTQIINQDSGYYVSPQDRRATDTIKDIVQNFTLAESIKSCEDLNCGFPLYSSLANQKSLWIPASPPLLIRTPVLRILSRQLIDNKSEVRNRLRYKYSLSGPDHMTLLIKPVMNCELVNWSFNVSISNLASPYHILYSYGTPSNDSTLFFWVEFDQNVNSLGGPCFDIAVSGHLNHHPIYRTDEFRSFLASFPKWTYVSGWMSSYESFKV